jgi:hypothetical protein
MIDKIYHYTHIDNLKYIFKTGLLSYNNIKPLKNNKLKLFFEDNNFLRPNFSIQSSKQLNLNDTVPFYIFKRNPQIDSLVKSKIYDQKNMIFLEFPIEIMKKYDGILSLGAPEKSIIDNNIYNYNSIPLDLFNFTPEKIKGWSPYQKRLEEPNFLSIISSCIFITGNVKISDLSRIVVYDLDMYKRVKSLANIANIDTNIVIGDGFDYFKSEFPYLYESIIGPNELYNKYLCFSKKMSSEVKDNPLARYNNIKDLKNALDNSLTALKETSELIGLETFNRVHPENVGNHTLSVVSNLKKSKEYRHLNSHLKTVVELAGYLHDIGKGPKSRWSSYEGLQLLDPNHPLKSMYMLERIFKEELKHIDKKDMILIIKLICYHDIIGDITAKGRLVSELKNILKSKNEFTALLALTKGDIYSICKEWVTNNESFFKLLKKKFI